MDVSGYLVTCTTLFTCLFMQEVPEISLTPSYIFIGESFALGCVFSDALIIGAEFQWADKKHSCVLSTRSDGSCSGTGIGCIGTESTCSSDHRNYTMTFKNVNASMNGESFLCRDIIYNEIKSRDVQLLVLERTLPTKHLYINTSECIVYENLVLSKTFVSVERQPETICSSLMMNGEPYIVIARSFRDRVNCSIDNARGEVQICYTDVRHSDAGTYSVLTDVVKNRRESGIAYMLGIFMVNITSLSINPGKVVNESDLVNMTCHFDSERKIEARWENNERIAKTEMTRKSNTYTIPQVSCKDSSIYSCSLHDGDRILASESAELLVNCQPSITDCSDGFVEIFVQPNGVLNITSTVLAYPNPIVDIFKDVNGEYNVSLTPATHVKTIGVVNVISFRKAKTTESDLGIHYLFATNNYGSTTCTYIVREETRRSEGLHSSLKDTNSTSIIVGVSVPVLLLAAVSSTAVVVYRKRKSQSRKKARNTIKDTNNKGSADKDVSSSSGIHNRAAYQGLDVQARESSEHQYSSIENEASSTSEYYELEIRAK